MKNIDTKSLLKELSEFNFVLSIYNGNYYYYFDEEKTIRAVICGSAMMIFNRPNKQDCRYENIGDFKKEIKEIKRFLNFQ